jgi:outer membrane protein
MQLSFLTPATKRVSAILLACALSTTGWAQEAAPSQAPAAPQPQTSTPPVQGFRVVDYSKGRSHFPNPLAPYTPRTVPLPNLTNTPRIDQLLKGGKLYLSMDDAVALALENNLDIAIQRYNLNIADTDILRTKAGSTILGVNTGTVLGTPGGGVGGFGGATSLTSSGAGGTIGGLGGAGAGTLGIVSSTLGIGATITSYDPILTGTVQFDRLKILCTSPFCGPSQNTSTANFAYTQGFQTGTSLSVGLNNNRVTSDSPFTIYSPSLNSNFRATVTQELLQGFGFAPNRRFIIFARNNREIADVAFRLQVTTTVDQIENMYWDLVNAYENVKVQQEALALAQKTLSDNQKQVQIGTLAPIEVVRAQSTVATNQQSLIVAQTNLELQQLLVKNALSRNLVDPVLADAEVIPTDTMLLPAVEPVVPTQDLVNDALSHRPELAESRIDLANRELSKKAVRNALLPSLNLFAYYGGSGIGGAQNPAATCVAGAKNNPFCQQPGTVASNGYNDTLSELVDSSAPDKGVGFTLNIPLRNRTAQANQIRSELEYRQAQMRLQQVENEIRIEVRNAQFAVQQNRASVAAAQAAVELAVQSLDAEQKKYALGASTSTLVLQQQSALTQARSNLISAQANYEKSRVELDRATGLLIERAGIDLADAETGQVRKMPAIPYVQPRKDAQPVMPSQPGQVPSTPPPQTQPQGQSKPPGQPESQAQPQPQPQAPEQPQS